MKRRRLQTFNTISLIISLVSVLFLSNVPFVAAATSSTGEQNQPQALHLSKIESYRSGSKQVVQDGGVVARDTEKIILTFDKSFTYADFISVTDSSGKPVYWSDCGRSCVAVADSDRNKVVILNPNDSLKMNEVYSIRLKADPTMIQDMTSNQPLYIDDSVTLKTADISIEKSYTMNLFAQNTKPSAVDSIRLIANQYTNKIHITPLHVAQGNDLRFLLVDSATKKVIFQTNESSIQSFDINVPKPGNYDLIAVYLMNDYVTSELQRTPVQMTISGQELTIPDSEASTLQFYGTDTPSIVGGEMHFTLNIDFNSKVGVLVDGEPDPDARGQNLSAFYSLSINTDRLKDGPHTLTVFASKPQSDNMRMISREILINRNDSFKDVPQSHWAHDNIERLHGLGIVDGRSNGAFQPDAPVTREEFLKMLVLTANVKAKLQPLSFADVSDSSWSKEYIDLGSSAGIVEGQVVSGNKMFYPKRTISRLEAVAMMARTDRLGSLPQPTNFIPGIADRSTIQPWGIPYVEKLFYYRWVQGYDDLSFRPQKSLTRAEAVMLLNSFTHDSNFPQNDALNGFLNSKLQWIIKQ